jgi:hypothetical protein
MNQWKALVNTVINLWVPENAEKFLSSCTTGDFSRRVQLHEVCLAVRGGGRYKQGKKMAEINDN